MKKSLLALAVLGAFAGAAQAQTAVTIYGSVDGGIRTDNSSTAGRVWKMNSLGTYNQNRLGFKGVEDLGGGLNAHFALESGWNGGTGAQDAAGVLFQRTALVGLGGSWGSVDLGRQYSVNFKTIGAYDPFNYKYTGIVPLATQGGIGTQPNAGVPAEVVAGLAAANIAAPAGLTRLSNDVQYNGTFGPLTVRAEHAFGEQASGFSNGSLNAIGVTYAEGPISVGGAYTRRQNNLSAAGAANYQTGKNLTVGAAYTLNPFRVAVGYADSKQDTGLAGAPEARAKDWWLGGSYTLTAATELTAGYYETKYTLGTGDSKHKLFMVGGTYALSKRTNLYADIDNHRYDASTGLTAAKNFTGVSLGVNHLF